MLYINCTIRKASTSDVFEVWFVEREFEDALRRDVPECFTLYTGEQFDLEQDCLLGSPLISSALPVDLVVVVQAHWTPARMPHFEKIRFEIEKRLSAWYDGRLKVEVHMVQINAPRRPALAEEVVQRRHRESADPALM